MERCSCLSLPAQAHARRAPHCAISAAVGVGFEQLACASLLAASHVNNRTSSIVSNLGSLTNGVTVTPLLYDSKFQEAASIIAYRDARANDAHAIVGAARSAVSTTLALLGSVDDMPQVSYWSSSPSLSNKDLYPMFGRTHPPDTAVTQALPLMLKHLGYGTIGVLHTNDDYANAYSEALQTSTVVNVAVSASFERDLPITQDPALTHIKASGVNVIVAVVFDGDAGSLFRKAEALGIYGAGFVWVTADATTLGAADADPFPEDTKQRMSGLLNFYASPGGTTGFGRLVDVWSTSDASACSNSIFDASSIAGLFGAEPFGVTAFVYDSVISLAAAAAKVANPANGTALYESLKTVAFDGASGPVSFDIETADRSSQSVTFVLDNWVAGADGELAVTTVSQVTNSTVQHLAPIYWFGGGDQPPDASLSDEASYLPDALSLAATMVAAVCIGVGIGFGLWALYHRHSKLIKVSQPGFLGAVVLGSCLSLSATFPAAIDHEGLDSDHVGDGATPSYPSVDFACNVQLWLYSVGFLITFGSIIIKIWNIMRIVNNTRVNLKRLSARTLVGLVASLVTVQVVILVAAYFDAPLRYKITVETSHGFVVNEYGNCEADGHAFSYLIVTLLLQLLVLVYANVLCYGARLIPSQYAETKFIAFACANHLQTKAFAVLAIAFTYSEPTVVFLVKWLALTVSDMGTLCLIFVPKLWMVHRDDSDDLSLAKEQLRAVAIQRWEKKKALSGPSSASASASATASHAAASHSRNNAPSPSERNSDDVSDSTRKLPLVHFRPASGRARVESPRAHPPDADAVIGDESVALEITLRSSVGVHAPPAELPAAGLEGAPLAAPDGPDDDQAAEAAIANANAIPGTAPCSEDEDDSSRSGEAATTDTGGRVTRSSITSTSTSSDRPAKLVLDLSGGRATNGNARPRSPAPSRSGWWGREGTAASWWGRATGTERTHCPEAEGA